jgi:hypothetical protein
LTVVDTSSPDKSSNAMALRRVIAAILGAVRRVLGSVYQVVFRDRLRDIDQQTERLGSASVEAVTHLGSEVRTLEARLEAIERELVALRELLERREPTEAEDGEKVPARPSG